MHFSRISPAVVLCCVVTLVVATPVARGQDQAAGTRSTVTRAPTARAPSPEFNLEASVGLFIGVSEFDRASEFSSVPFAVDDAVDLAYLFSVELGLIPPANVTLALSGEPRKPQSTESLERLLEAGARRTEATYIELNDQLAELERGATGSPGDGLLVVAVASHGTVSHVLPSDARPGDRLERTAIEVQDLSGSVSRAPAARRILLIDACREALMTGRAVGGLGAEPMSEEFHRALTTARGTFVLNAAPPGGYAFDDETEQNGVFSAAILRGMRGGADAVDGFVTLGSLQTYVDREVLTWVRANRPGITAEQGISVQADPVSLLDMPLREHPDRLRQRSAHAIEVLNSAFGERKLGGDVVDQVRAQLDAPREELEPLLSRIELFEQIMALGNDAASDLYADDFELWWDESGRPALRPPDQSNPREIVRFEQDGTRMGTLETADLLGNRIEDRYSFAGRAGQLVRISMASAFDNRLLLENPGGTILSNVDDSHNMLVAQIETTLPTDGEYRIRATSYQYRDVGDYRLTLAFPNQYVVDGSVTTDNPSNLWVFRSTEAQSVWLGMQAPDFAPRLSLHQGRDRPIATNASAEGDPSFHATLPSPGYYLVTASARESRVGSPAVGTGSYRLTLETDPRRSLVSVDGIVRAGDTVSGALSDDDPLLDANTDTASYFDYWVLEGTRGQRIRLTLNANFDARVLVRNGMQVDLLPGSSTTSEDADGLEVELPEDGPFMVLVAATGMVQAEYQLVVE